MLRSVFYPLSLQVIESTFQSVWAERTTDIFLLLRLRSLLASGASDLQTSHIEEAEMAAIFSASDNLLGDNVETKQAILNGFLFRQGDFEGISCRACSFFLRFVPTFCRFPSC